MLAWCKQDIEGVVLDLITEACAQQFEDKYEAVKYALDTDSKGRWSLDSNATWQAVSYVSDFFQVQEETITESFLRHPNVSSLCEVALFGLHQTEPQIKFYTSGSQSKPKPVVHGLENLLREAKVWGELFPEARQIYSLVPRQHIYGFIWTVLLPKLLSVPLRDLRKKMLHQHLNTEPGVLVTVPALLPLMSTLSEAQKHATSVVLSTSPYPFEKLQQLQRQGYLNTWQIYGSTETGGVGCRNQHQEYYQLRSNLVCRHLNIYDGQRMLPIQDELSFVDDTYFEILGRVDKKIQLNGYNVDISHLTRTISNLPEVEEVSVKLTGESESLRLKVFVATPLDESMKLREQILAQLSTYISARDLSFGKSVPRNELGKVASW